MLIVLSSFLPILVLLICLMVLKFPASKAGAVSFLTALVISIITFKPGIEGLSIMLSKGFGLAIFVVFIIWGAMFLYNLVKEVGALEIINRNIQIIVEDKYVQFMLLAWVFAPFLQGIAGFGIPVIVVAPILIAMGFDPIISAAGVLLGHSWSISFGSMGSSIYAIDMVTDAELGDILVNMALFGAVSMVCMGIAVSIIYGGKKALIQGLPYVLFTSAAMSVTLYTVASLEMVSVIGLSTGTVGLVTMYIVYRIRNRRLARKKLYKDKLSLVQSILPYILIVAFSVVFFILNPKISFNLSFPGYNSMTGIAIKAEDNYVKFNLLKYPFCIIMMSSLISMILYRKKGCFDTVIAKKIISNTVKKCVPTTITLIFLLCMAQIMMDSQMISNMASVLVAIAGKAYPMVAPFIGLLGAFITGSNTNSNVLFGALQESAAISLNLTVPVVCAVQSLGASIGNAIGPTTVALGATSAQISGEESKIYKFTLVPVLITALIQGIINLIILNVI